MFTIKLPAPAGATDLRADVAAADGARRRDDERSAAKATLDEAVPPRRRASASGSVGVRLRRARQLFDEDPDDGVRPDVPQ